MAEWWTFVTMPTRPCLSPSTTQSSHSGRERSSCVLATWPATSPSSRRPPGDGRRDPADVVVEVEVRILDPDRVVDAERHLHDPAAERRHEVHGGRR